MLEYGVTDKGYELLEETGLDKRIKEKWNTVQSKIPHRGFLNEWEIEDLLENKDLASERQKAVKNWLKETSESNRNPRDLFILSGTITDAILTEEERADYKQFGVESLSQLDGLLAAFCLVRDSDNLISPSNFYAWHSEGFRTQIYGLGDGDLRMCQVQTKPKHENELFARLPKKLISAAYEYWTHLGATALKFADTVGIEIPEAQNWRGLMKEYGWDGTIIKPYGGKGGGYENFAFQWFERILAQLPDKTDVRKVKRNFFGQMSPYASHDFFHLPVIDLDQNLVIYSNDGSGEGIELAPEGVPIECYPVVHIPKTDVEHLFKGVVHGIMTKQSRTQPSALAYMLWEHEQIKAGKSYDEIREASRQFE